MSMMIRRRKKIQEARVSDTRSLTEASQDNKPLTDTYTKTDIFRMSKADLQSLAGEVGIDSVGLNGNQLKDALIEHFGL